MQVMIEQDRPCLLSTEIVVLPAGLSENDCRNEKVFDNVTSVVFRHHWRAYSRPID